MILHIDIDNCFFLFKIHSLNGGPGGSSITVIQVILSARNIRSRHETNAFCTSSCDGLRNGRSSSSYLI